MTTTSETEVTFAGPIQHLRSARAGARPGDGTIRSLLDGEWFINQADGIAQTLAANGQLLTFGTSAADLAAAQTAMAAAFPTLLADLFPAFLASLPTAQPSTAGVLWLNGGNPQISQPQGS